MVVDEVAVSVVDDCVAVMVGVAGAFGVVAKSLDLPLWRLFMVITWPSASLVYVMVNESQPPEAEFWHVVLLTSLCALYAITSVLPSDEAIEFVVPEGARGMTSRS